MTIDSADMHKGVANQTGQASQPLAHYSPPVEPQQIGAGLAAMPVEHAVKRVQAVSDRLVSNIAGVISGKYGAIRSIVCTFLAGGNVLIEDVPGVGKTALASALARSIGGTVSRIQFTADLLPSDITGLSVFSQKTREFEFHPGPIFANIVIGDEINRATPKTQSALLEAMAERQVTVDGVTRMLEEPFAVFATQNPHDMEGTFALPEAQRDRFMTRVSLGYPSAEAELAMLKDRETVDPASRVEMVATKELIRECQQAVQRVFLSDALQRYIIALTSATRTAETLALGASPRATLHLARATKALAAMQGRAFALPDDVVQLAPLVLSHRLVPASRVLGDREATEVAVEAVGRILASTPVPSDA